MIGAGGDSGGERHSKWTEENMYNKGAKSGPGKVVAPNKLWHAFKHKNLDVFKRELTCCLSKSRDGRSLELETGRGA